MSIGPRLRDRLGDGALYVVLAPVWFPVNIGLWLYLWLMDAEENDRQLNESIDEDTAMTAAQKILAPLSRPDGQTIFRGLG